MFKYSRKSLSHYNTLHPDLKKILDKLLEFYDHTILCGHRDVEEQLKLFNSKASKLKFGKHNVSPSRAVDITPYPIPENWGEIDYSNPPEAKELERIVKERARFYHMIGCVKAIASIYGIKIRCGADWNNDNNFIDQNFDDLVHIELEDEEESN